MMGAFGAEGVLDEARVQERERLWDRVRALGRWLALAAATAALCGAAGGTAGFAMALVVAALLAGRSLGALLIGCAAGALRLGLDRGGQAVLWGAGIALAGTLACGIADALREPGQPGWRAILRRTAKREGPRLQARSPTRKDQRRSALLAGAATLPPGLILAGASPVPTLAATASGVAAACAAPFLLSALAVKPSRRFLSAEERVGLMLLAGMLAAGAGALCLPAAAALCAALSVLLYPAGAAAGLGLGLALLLSGGDGRLVALLGAGGLAAQLCAQSSPWVRGGASAGALMILALLMQLPPGDLACAAAALVPALLPARLQRTLARWARPPRDACDPDRVAALARGGAVARLDALSAAFGELAEGYRDAGETPDEQALIARMRERLCDGCPGYGACWTGERGGAVRLLCDFIARAVEWSAGDMDAPLFAAEPTPELMRRCRRGRQVSERLGELLEDFARARQAELKRGAENRLISAQFREATQLLDGMADALSRPVRLRGRQAERAAAALEAAGVPVGGVLALSGPWVELAVTLREGCWDRELAEVAAQRLRRAFGRVYCPEGPWGRELRFVRRPRLRAETGAVCASRRAGAPSGDSHLVLELDGDRLLVLLCDGMGSGDGAARESAAAVRLLARFMEAGADSAHAVETVNALLLNRSREETFATVDMLVVELSTGVASFTKLAACPTLILGGDAVRRVQGGRLPLGILERVQPARTRVALSPGDTLVMLSDGAWEAVGQEGLAALLAQGETDMNALAERVLDAAVLATPPEYRDDMTAICLRILAA